MKKILLITAVAMMAIGVNAETVIQTDMKDWKNVEDGAPPVAQTNSGTYNLTVGQATLGGATWMRTDANRPQYDEAYAADTIGLRWVRFGGNPTITDGLPNQFVEFKNTDVPFENGGTITALVTSNSGGRTLDVWSVELKSVVAQIAIPTAPKILYSVPVQLPTTLNGIHTLRFVRSDSGPFLWGLLITTGTTNVKNINNDAKIVLSKTYFDVLGKEVPADSKGLIFVKTLYKDGTSDVQKFYKK